MEEVQFEVRENEARIKGRAREKVREAIRAGRAPNEHQFARARGLVLRERQNSIFSDAWIPLSILIIIGGLIANRNAAVVAVGVGMIVIVLVSSWWRRIALIGVTYERSFDRNHVFPGEPVTLTLTITNRKPVPLTWLQFKDQVPIAPEEAGMLAVIASQVSETFTLETSLSTNAYERTYKMLRFRFPRRGLYDLGPVRYLSGDIFTLFTIEREHRYIDRLTVYPRVWPLETLSLPAKEMFGEINVRRSLFADPIRTQGIRDYQPQDRFRDVHWKATARRGDLQTKVYDPSTGMTVVTFLNVATFAKHWMGFNADLLERAVSVAASITSYCADQKWGIGIYANGSVPRSDQPIRVPPGRSPDQLMHVLEALAAVTEFATGSIELLMHRESKRLPLAATLVLVTGVVNDEMLVGLLRLKEAGRRITLISLAEEAPPPLLEGILTYHIPSTTPAFQDGAPKGSETEVALGNIPSPGSLELELEEVIAPHG
ncbi:MAG: DUF58 domain-containing protein [Chloroflexota bacterium]|nr:MAG: DUF58 domain-containing protein [Chloroflexota bacterium]